MLFRKITALVLVSSLLFAKLALADPKGFFSLQIENDAWVGLDKHYTSGVMLSYFPLKPAPDWLTSSLKGLGLSVAPNEVAVEYLFGNAIFTPKDFESTQPLPNQRPWAGHTFVSFAAMRKPQAINNYLTVGDRLSVTLGLVGPASGGEQGQKILHEVIGSPKPGGWEYQLANEPTFNLHYLRRWHFYQPLAKGYELELAPSASLALGSPYTYGGLGFMLRLGPNLSQDFGPPAIQPNYAGSSYFAAGKPWHWYLMAGIEYRYMQYNLFLDGTLFSNGPSIEKYKQVDDIFVGGAISYHKVRLAVTTVYRAKEFVGQEKRDIFGSFNLSFYY